MSETMEISLDQIQFGNELNENNYFDVFILGDFILTRSDFQCEKKLSKMVEKSMLSIVNMEAPICSEGEKIKKSGPILTSAEETGKVLDNLGFDAASLANNHTMDMGTGGLENTINTLEKNSIKTFGAGFTTQEAMNPLYFESDDVSISVCNFCEREFGVSVDGTPGTSWVNHPDTQNVTREALTNSHITIAIIHGGIMHVPVPLPGQQSRYRNFVNSGIDLVAGHHSHVPCGWESYQRSPILYGLGNFHFPIDSREYSDLGLGVGIQLENNGLKQVTVIPIKSDSDSTRLLRSGEKKILIDLVETSNRIIDDQEKLELFWKKLSTEIYNQRYKNHFNSFEYGILSSLIFRPTDSVSNLISGGFNQVSNKENDRVRLLNFIRNESHREVITTALEELISDQETVLSEEEIDKYNKLLSKTSLD